MVILYFREQWLVGSGTLCCFVLSAVKEFSILAVVIFASYESEADKEKVNK